MRAALPTGKAEYPVCCDTDSQAGTLARQSRGIPPLLAGVVSCKYTMKCSQGAQTIKTESCQLPPPEPGSLPLLEGAST